MATASSGNPESKVTELKTEASLKDISQQLEALKADLSNLAGAMGDYGKGKAKQARSTAEGYAHTARNTAEGQYDYLTTEAERYGREAQRMVREQPAAALGVAAGIGFLVGLFASRR
ncbi:DUF883 family protein [Pelagovum pacificum]|uniref:DUF883 domain-containing protein n=1 Tax=Pelagovum pacificum TaxID=2588711 RepID=A0A5C5G7J9_9RHOB|nr:DUF883 family protein [Pelagovum pacificum]QQA41868.1 DUF883 domain-containing protein [Pelagovum pacificum]TNY30689.1 DUF883 domain-containing protein [Pelagovum pacificum]